MKKPDWQDNLLELTANDSQDEKIEIIYCLLGKYKPNHEDAKLMSAAIVWFIDNLNLPCNQLAKTVFNDLKNEADIKNMNTCLKLQWEIYSYRTIRNCNSLALEINSTNYSLALEINTANYSGINRFRGDIEKEIDEAESIGHYSKEFKEKSDLMKILIKPSLTKFQKILMN